MSKSKIAPYVFLSVLLLILVFIAGLRYGQQVEKSNKIIDYLISLPPTKIPPSPTTLEFKTFSHPGCGVSFLFPNQYRLISQSSSSALLVASREEPALEFNCSLNNPFADKYIDNKIATSEVSLFKKKLITKSYNGALIFPVKNLGKTVYFYIPQSLFPVFEKSLELVNP